ncbi:hypothetical protein G6F24_016101 [Rhizopus arrhizus]|nr:hypothetical protein G6F24_016101 [Rhizopus arrhizus]
MSMTPNPASAAAAPARDSATAMPTATRCAMPPPCTASARWPSRRPTLPCGSARPPTATCRPPVAMRVGASSTATTPTGRRSATPASSTASSPLARPSPR